MSFLCSRFLISKPNVQKAINLFTGSLGYTTESKVMINDFAVGDK